MFSVCRFRTEDGQEIRIGDYLMQTEADGRMYIGRAVKVGGAWRFRRESRFSARDRQFIPLQSGAVNDCYDRPIAPTRSRLYWAIHKRCVPGLTLLQRVKQPERGMRVTELRAGIDFETPVPI